MSELAATPQRALFALDGENAERTGFSFASSTCAVELLGLREGYRLLDVGCVAGNYASSVDHPVSPTGRVIGIDLSAAVIEVARLGGLYHSARARNVSSHLMLYERA